MLSTTSSLPPSPMWNNHSQSVAVWIVWSFGRLFDINASVLSLFFFCTSTCRVI